MIDFREDYMVWKKANEHTQKSIAELIDVPRGTIASFESGRSPLPAGETLLKLIEQIYPGFRTERVTPDYACMRCHSAVPGPAQGASHCCKCGHRFGVGCGCGAVAMLGAKFCSECGKPLA